MITKAIILNRIINTNTYSVRVPFLESSINETGERVATVSSNASISGEYRDGDVVYVSFEDHKANKPVIVGKLYLEDNEPRGFGNFESLNVKSSANLPLNTMFGSIAISSIINKLENLPSEEDENVVTPIVNFSRNLLTNINNISVVGYRLTTITDGYIIQTSNSQKLTEQLAKKYLLTIMGSAYLPLYDESTSTHTNVYSYVICVNDGVVYRYEYNETQGLVAYNTFTMSGGGIGNYLPLSGGDLYGPLGLKARQEATNRAIIEYEEEENQHTNLKITNSSGDIHINSKYDPEDDEHTSEYGTYIDGVLMKVLSEDEIENILGGQN